MKNLTLPRFPKLMIAGATLAALLAARPVFASVVGPYSSDAYTTFLFHLDEPAGSTTATNTATLTAGTNAAAFKQNSATTNNATADTSILGVTGASGFGFGNFGNCAVITNSLGLTNVTTGGVSNGLGIDFNLNNAYNYFSNATTVANAGDSQPNGNLLLGQDSSFTLEALVNLSTTNVPTVGREIVCADSGGTRGFQFRIIGSRLEFNSQPGVAAGANDIFAPIPSSGPHAFVSNAWFHVALVHSEVGGSPTNIFYWTSLDDTLTVANAILVTNTATVNFAAQLPLVIGNEGRLNGGSTEGLRGLIDEVRISRIARAANQMMFSTPTVSVVQQPVNEGVDYGGTGSLYVSAASSLPLSYQWRLNNSNITGATNAIYTFANATAANGGNYDCVIANSSPSVTTSAVAVVTIGAVNFLAHRYGFTNDANDSIGGANGALFGDATAGSGVLQLDGTVGTYMQLPSFLITNMGMVTFECWASYGVPSTTFARLFDFGNTNGTVGNNYLFFSPHGTTTHRADIGTTNNEQMVDVAGVFDNRTVQVTCVFDPINRQISVYTNGVLEAVNGNVTFQLSGVNDVYSFIGRSLYSADAYLSANIDELRIYNGALSAASVRQSYLQGPDTALSDGAVTMLVSPTNTTTAQSQPVSFFGLAGGHPPINYQWYENGSPVANATNSTLSFVASFGQNNHSFRLWATNVFGGVTNVASSTAALLTVLVPETLTWIGANGNGWNTASLNWSNATALVPYVSFDGALFDSRGSGQPNVDIQFAANPIALTVNANSDYVFTSSAQNGSLSGTADLLKQGSGMLTLDVTNTMTGATIIQNGTLQIGNGGNAGGLNAGPLTNNGALVFNIASDLTYSGAVNGSGSLSDIGPSGTVTLSGPFNGSTVTLSGAANLVLSGSNNYSGPTTISSGVLHVRNDSALGSAAAGTTISSGGQLFIDANINLVAEALAIGGTAPALHKGGGGATALGGVVTLTADTVLQVDGNSTLTLTNPAGLSGSGDINLSLNGDAGAQGTVSGPLTLGAGTLTKNGAGTWTLASAVNSYSGKTAINGANNGLLRVAAATGLGTAPGAFTPDQITLSGSALGATANFALDDGRRGITVIGAGVLSAEAGVTLTISNEITGSGTLEKIGAGTVILSGANSFTGVLNVGNDPNGSGMPGYPSFVNDGNLRVNTSSAVGGIVLINILENNGGNSTLQLDGTAGDVSIPATITMLARTPLIPGIQNLAGSNTLSGSFTITTGGNVYWLQSDAGTLVFAGPMSVALGAGGNRFLTFLGNGNISVPADISTGGDGSTTVLNITKTGLGTLTLGGNNTYNGGTVISNGTLLVSGSINGGGVTNYGGRLGGTGTIGVPVVIAPGGVLSPGASIGTLTINSDLTLGGNLLVEVNKSLSQSNDLVVVSGALANTGTGVVSVSNLGPALGIGDTFKLFSQPVANGGALNVVGSGAIWNNNLALNGTISVASTTVPHPHITNITLNGPNLEFNGTNGYANGAYLLLSSTNLTAPLSTWTPLATNNFDGLGHFSVTNAVAVGTPQRFYLLQVP